MGMRMMVEKTMEKATLRLLLEGQQHRLIDGDGNIPFRGTLSKMAEWVENQGDLTFRLNHVSAPLSSGEFVEFLNRVIKRTKRTNGRSRALKR